jgi:hypothetical protein
LEVEPSVFICVNLGGFHDLDLIRRFRQAVEEDQDDPLHEMAERRSGFDLEGAFDDGERFLGPALDTS